MKKRIFAITMMVLITLSLFVPISVSAEETEETMLLKAGAYTFNETINHATQSILSYEDFTGGVKVQYVDLKHTVYVNGSAKTYNQIRCCYSDFPRTTGENSTAEYVNYTKIISYTSILDKKAIYQNGYEYYESSSGITENTYNCEWNIDERKIVISDDQEVAKTTYNWFVKVTDYNTVNGQPSQGTPDYDTPEVTYTIPAGLYIFNETPTMPVEDITQDFPTYFSVMVNNGLENVVYNGLRMKFTTTTIEYNLDGTLTTVYKAPPLADGGWSIDAYRQVTFLEDVTVSEDFYNLFILNTTPPPEYKPPYVFTNDGITYDGNTFATYKDENTKRVDVDNTYCAMFDNGYVYIVSSTEPFRIASSGHVRPNPSINFDMWYIENGVINYMGTNTSFNPEKWVAGNHSILNWDNDAQYHGFDIGMVFPTTPQTQLPTVVGAEMMMGVMTEMIAILPCLIALLTGYLALRKALVILRQILQTA